MKDQNQSPLTDPARELVELCSSLTSGAGTETGDRYLAARFGVTPYSTDFYRLIVAIVTRLDYLEAILGRIDIDDDFRAEMVPHLELIRSVFGPQGFQNHWSSYGARQVGADNVQPLKALSAAVRREVSYRKLTHEDAAAITTDAQELLSWLLDANLGERDFIRGLLIEALEEFLFRVKHLQWIGIGYTLEGLKSVIRAYLALERSDIDATADPVSSAALRKVGTFLEEVWKKTQTARDAAETGSWALKMYGAYEAISHGAPVVKALLSVGG